MIYVIRGIKFGRDIFWNDLVYIALELYLNEIDCKEEVGEKYLIYIYIYNIIFRYRNCH